MTTPGIGASGILGLALEEVTPPVLNALATAATGGTIADGIWRYKITAINAYGETYVSNEQSITTAGGGLSTITLTWATVVGATGYKIYRTAVNGAANSELLRATVGLVLTYVDTAPGVPAGAMPLLNSANATGVYKVPTKFIPILSESITYQQATVWRRPMRGSSGLIGAIQGDAHIEGDIQFEVTSDTLIYFMYSMRCSMTKTGTGPYTYVFTPTSDATTLTALSITIIRNGISYGYVGCSVTSLSIEVQNEELIATASIIGLDETVQGVPTATWPTLIPFGALAYSLQIPTATQVYDTDTFQFQLNGNGDPQFRLSNSKAAQFVAYGESEGTISIARDFLSRAEYDAFKSLTAKSLTFLASNSGSDQVSILAPVSIVDTYEIPLSGQGDLVRASIVYQLAIDGTGKHYQMTVITPTESIF